jgi:hypothetical protein
MSYLFASASDHNMLTIALNLRDGVNVNLATYSSPAVAHHLPYNLQLNFKNAIGVVGIYLYKTFQAVTQSKSSNIVLVLSTVKMCFWGNLSTFFVIQNVLVENHPSIFGSERTVSSHAERFAIKKCVSKCQLERQLPVGQHSLARSFAKRRFTPLPTVRPCPARVCTAAQRAPIY